MSEVPYVSTPEPVVKRMLQLARLKPGEVLYDLGAGDGRIVVSAANDFSVKSVGVEIHPSRIDMIRDRVRSMGLRDEVMVLGQNFFKTDLSNANVVTLYLLRQTNRRLRRKLEEELKPGARVITHDYDVPGWLPKKTIYVKYGGRMHKIYLYEAPFDSCKLKLRSLFR